MKTKENSFKKESIGKVQTGIAGFDEITLGGLPQGRATLICGNTGCGKTVFGMEFLVRGAIQYNEPGVFIAFEEKKEDLAKNVASLGFDLNTLEKQNKIAIDYIQINPSEIIETGEYDLEGLFIRLNYAINKVGAKRIVIDTIETLFSSFKNKPTLRSEINRLFNWIKEKGVTAIITGEEGIHTMTREGLEEYVSDCVICLNHNVLEGIYTRRLRIVKYRGSTHQTNEFPFIINSKGISILPITSLKMEHTISEEMISLGNKQLNEMIGGKGPYKGSSVLISGTAGTGKTSLNSTIANAACARGEKVLYFSFEESPDQIKRNMKSIGIDLQKWEDKKLLFFHSERTNAFGLENHLTHIYNMINNINPALVLFDPITGFINGTNNIEVKSMITRLIDFVKSKGTTGFYTNLVSGDAKFETSTAEISSLIDTWIFLKDIELNGERNRTIHVLKSRGVKNSNQIREFHLTSTGIELREPYIGSGGVVTGSARVIQEKKDLELTSSLLNELEKTKLELDRQKKINKARMELLKVQNETEILEIVNAVKHIEKQIISSKEEKVKIEKLRNF